MKYPRTLSLVLACSFLLFLAIGCGSRQVAAPPPADPVVAPAARPPLQPISGDAFRQLPEAQQVERREAAAEHLEKFREVDWYMHDRKRLPTQAFRPLYIGMGVIACLQHLNQALEIDPDNAEAWIDRADYTIKLGDRATARRYFDEALVALESRPDSVTATSRGRIARAQAWLCYDLGHWEEGLAWVDALEEIERLDHQAQLCRGLLHAGAGHLVEANQAAQDLGPASYRKISQRGVGSYDGISGGGYTGLSHANSKFCSDWIRARTRIASGEFDLAVHILGELYWCRRGTPYARRYWTDVGMIYELGGRLDEASTAYGIGFINLPDRMYLPSGGFSTQTTILGKPSPRSPVFASFADHYLGGSHFGLAAQLVRECLTTGDAQRKKMLGAQALDWLAVCIRKNIWPERAWALRGRVLFALGDYAAAEVDLRRGHELLVAAELVDPMTCFLLGTVHMEREEPGEALPWFEEAVAADLSFGGAWRSLSVALLQTGDPERGRAAIDRAIELQPSNLAGHYNRGLLNVQEGRWDQALTDLTRASNLAPNNQQVQRLYASAMEGRQNAEIAAAYASGGLDAAAMPEIDPTIADPTAEDVAAMMQRAGSLLRDASERRQLPENWEAVDDLTEADFLAILPLLEKAWATEPNPELRHDLALTYLRSGQPDKTLAILLPNWGHDVSALEMRLVIAADRALGNSERAFAEAEALLDADAVLVDPTYWSLVGAILFENDEQASAYAAFAQVDDYYTRTGQGDSFVTGSGWSGPDAVLPVSDEPGHYFLSAAGYNAARKYKMANRAPSEGAPQTK